MRLQKKAVVQITLTYLDGTHETFYPPNSDAAYYAERLTYGDDEKGKITTLLDCHEVYWVIRHEGKTAREFLSERAADGV